MVRCIVGCVCENERMYSWGVGGGQLGIRSWGMDRCIVGCVCVKVNRCIPGVGGDGQVLLGLFFLGGGVEDGQLFARE